MRKKFTLSWKIFREINWNDNSVYLQLISRNFCWKILFTQCVCKLQKFSLTLFSQKIRESNGFTKKLIIGDLTKFFQWEEISRFSTLLLWFKMVWKYEKFTLGWQNISSNQLFLSKNVTFTKFLPKSVLTAVRVHIHICTVFNI